MRRQFRSASEIIAVMVEENGKKGPRIDQLDCSSSLEQTRRIVQQQRANVKDPDLCKKVAGLCLEFDGAATWLRRNLDNRLYDLTTEMRCQLEKMGFISFLDPPIDEDLRTAAGALKYTCGEFFNDDPLTPYAKELLEKVCDGTLSVEP